MNRKRLIYTIAICSCIGLVITALTVLLLRTHTTLQPVITETGVRAETKVKAETEATTRTQSGDPEEYNSTLVQYAYYIAPTPCETTSVVFNCDGGIFCLNLTRERLEEIRSTFDADSSLHEVLLGPESNLLSEPKDPLHFVLYRGDFTFLFDYFQENGSPNSSLTLISEIPKDAVEDQAEIPSDTYRVIAFFGQEMVDELLAGMEAAEPTPSLESYCLIKQRLDLEGNRHGFYRVFYDELFAMYQTLSVRGVNRVRYVVDILPYSDSIPASDT